jgi:hypothetical protein
LADGEQSGEFDISAPSGGASQICYLCSRPVQGLPPLNGLPHTFWLCQAPHLPPPGQGGGSATASISGGGLQLKRISDAGPDAADGAIVVEDQYAGNDGGVPGSTQGPYTCAPIGIPASSPTIEQCNAMAEDWMQRQCPGYPDASSYNPLNGCFCWTFSALVGWCMGQNWSSAFSWPANPAGQSCPVAAPTVE